MIILGTNSIKATGSFDVANSLRFNNDSSDNLSRTPSSSSNRRTFTFSTWFKLSGTDGALISAGTNISNGPLFIIDMLSGSNIGTLRVEDTVGGDNVINLRPTRKLRDFSSWYHLCVAIDTTQGTASNRVKLYINGTQETSFGTEDYPNQNLELSMNQNHITRIGTRATSLSGKYFDGYMCETVLVDGSQLAPDQFGEFDSDTNIWKPIDVSGLTFGTNGFYLDFEDSSALGDDVSGNGNDFTVNNLTAIDQSTDTCTNNFATFNAAHPALANAGFSEGNLQFASDGSASTQNPASSSIAVSTGKWYAEFNVVAESTDNGSFSYVGVAGTATWVSAANNGYYIGNQADTIAFNGNQSVYSAGNEIDNSETNYANGNIVGVAADFTNSKIYFHVNGTYINSGDPAGASNGYDIPATAQSFYYFAVSTFGKNATWQANFGSPPYAISSGNTDGNGYGNFEYAVPSGYFALCTKNLAEYG